MERSELEKIMRLIGQSVRRCVCPSVCLCTRIDGDMHSNERLLVCVAVIGWIKPWKYQAKSIDIHHDIY